MGRPPQFLVPSLPDCADVQVRSGWWLFLVEGEEPRQNLSILACCSIARASPHHYRQR